jgi:hypothetical protein
MRRSAMKKIFIGITALALLVASPAPAGDNAPWLESDTAYYFAGDQVRDPSWLLGWEGTIQGDVNGVLRWWIDLAEWFPPDYVARWEVLDCDPVDPSSCPYDPDDPDDPAPVIMAGYSAGTNFAPVDGVVEWSGKGVVTFVVDHEDYPQYAKWFGRRTTEGGWYSLDEEGNPTGVGPFVIYDRPSNKH